MLKIITYLFFLAAPALFCSQAYASSPLFDGNASIGCNMSHGISYNEQEDANKIVEHVTNVFEVKPVRESEPIE